MKKERGKKKTGPIWARLGAIGLVSLMVVGFGLYLGGSAPTFATVFRRFALPGLGRSLAVLPGTEPHESYSVFVNNMKMDFIRSSSRLSPGEIIEKYARDARGNTIVDKWLRELPLPEPSLVGKIRASGNHLAKRFLSSAGLIRFSGRTFGMLSYIDQEKRNVAVLAFRNPVSGGSDYFISRTDKISSLKMEPDADGDMPGRDAEDVPRPPFSQRILSLERPDKGMLFLVYESRGSVVATLNFYRSNMPYKGWVESPLHREVFREQGIDDILYFEKSGSKCIISVDWDRRSGIVTTTIIRLPKN